MIAAFQFKFKEWKNQVEYKPLMIFGIIATSLALGLDLKNVFLGRRNLMSYVSYSKLKTIGAAKPSTNGAKDNSELVAYLYGRT